MILLGLTITFLTATVLFIEFFRHRQSRLAAYGWVGLIGLIIAEWLLFRGFQPVASRLFALVWIGFVFLLDPINYRLGLPSLIGDFAAGRRDRFYSLLASGFACGWFWEFWNYWADAKWRYIFPMFQSWKIFEM